MSCQLISLKSVVLGALLDLPKMDENSVQWSLQHLASEACSSPTTHIHISPSEFLYIGASKSRPCKTLTYLLASACRQQKCKCSDGSCRYAPLVRMRIKYDLSRKWRFHQTNIYRLVNTDRAVSKYETKWLVGEHLSLYNLQSYLRAHSTNSTLIKWSTSWPNLKYVCHPKPSLFVLKRLHTWSFCYVKKTF